MRLNTRLLILAAAALVGFSGNALGQVSTNYYWNGGSGTWNSSIINLAWRLNDPSAGSLTHWQNANAVISPIAHIGNVGSPGTITVGEDITAERTNINASGYTLAPDPGGTLYFIAGPVNITGAYTLTIGDAAQTGLQQLAFRNNVTGASGAGINLAGNQTSNNAILVVLQNGATFSVPTTVTSTGTGLAGFQADGGTSALNATVANNTSAYTLFSTANAGTLNVNGVVSGTSGVRFGANPGTINVNVAQTYQGDTQFDSASSGTVKLGLTNALPTGTNVVMGVTSNGFSGQLDLNGFNQQVASISVTDSTGTGGITNTAATTTSTLTIGGASSTVFGRPITDGSATAKVALSLGSSHTGMLNLTGTSNTYSGGTTVNGGTLVVANASGSATGTGAVQVNSGGTLGGNNAGAIAGAVTVASGGKLEPGAGGQNVGTLRVGNNVSLQLGSTFTLQIQGATPGTEHDQLVVTSGDVALAGTLAAEFSLFPPTGNEQIMIINNTGAGSLTGTFSNAPVNGSHVANHGGYGWYIVYGSAADAFGGSGGNDVVLFAVVPEPSHVLALCGAAAAAGLAARRLRRRIRATSGDPLPAP